MKSKIKEFLSLDETREIEFREMYGFTFAFEKNVMIFGGEMASAEMKPVAIIYEENGEYYLAPLYDKVDIEAILKKYVEEFL